MKDMVEFELFAFEADAKSSLLQQSYEDDDDDEEEDDDKGIFCSSINSTSVFCCFDELFEIIELETDDMDDVFDEYE